MEVKFSEVVPVDVLTLVLLSSFFCESGKSDFTPFLALTTPVQHHFLALFTLNFFTFHSGNVYKSLLSGVKRNI
jgi:hypothetical protein